MTQHLAFKAALGARTHREEQHRPNSPRTVSSLPLGIDKLSKQKWEEKRDEEFLILDAYANNGLKPNFCGKSPFSRLNVLSNDSENMLHSTRCRSSSMLGRGSHAQDAIELSDDDVTALKPELRKVNAKHVIDLDDLPDLPIASEKAGNVIVEQFVAVPKAIKLEIDSKVKKTETADTKFKVLEGTDLPYDPRSVSIVDTSREAKKKDTKTKYTIEGTGPVSADSNTAERAACAQPDIFSLPSKRHEALIDAMNHCIEAAHQGLSHEDSSLNRKEPLPSVILAPVSDMSSPRLLPGPIEDGQSITVDRSRLPDDLSTQHLRAGDSSVIVLDATSTDTISRTGMPRPEFDSVSQDQSNQDMGEDGNSTSDSISTQEPLKRSSTLVVTPDAASKDVLPLKENLDPETMLVTQNDADQAKNGDQANDASTYGAPTAYMGPRRSFRDEKSPDQSLPVDPVHEHTATATARGATSEVDTRAPDGSEEEQRHKAQETLSEMERMLREGKRKREDAETERAMRAEALVKKKSQELRQENDQKRKMEAQEKRQAILKEEARKFLERSRKVGSQETTNQPNVHSAPEKSVTHLGPTGLQIGLATLGLNKPDVVRANVSIEQDTCRPQTPMSSGLWMTNRQEPVGPSSSFNTAGGQIQSTRSRRSSAADLFIRDSTTPPPRTKPKVFNSEVIEFAGWSNNGTHRTPKKRGREGLTIPDFFCSNKRQSTIIGSTRGYKYITLEEGYFDRHEERIKALKARADRENRAYEETFDGQEVSLFLDSDDDHQTKARPTTGGKGLSKKTLKRWRADAQAYPTPSQSEIDQEDHEMPKILYEYHVQRRSQLEGQDEEQARTEEFGPYYTVAEANAIAANKVRQGNQENANAVFRPGAWSFKYEKDDAAMESHSVFGQGGTIQTRVTRTIAPPEQDVGIPLNAFTTPAWMYIAMASSGKPTATDNDQPMNDNEVIRPHDKSSMTTVVKACTLLDLANRAAGQKWIELQAADFPNDALGDIHRAEMEMNVRQDLQEMDEETMSFDRTYRDPASGLETHIWVEMVEVEGPRN